MAKYILIISTFFPPIQHIATNRIYSFAKYLSLMGYKVTVLTIDQGLPEDKELELKNVEVFRVKDADFFRPARFDQWGSKYVHYAKCAYNKILYYFKTDEFSGWAKAALPIARKIMGEKNIDCMISSYPPLAPHGLAEILKQENMKVKWILDMRDAMSWSSSVPINAKKVLEEKEKRFLLLADALISVSKPQLERFAKNNIRSIPLREIRNGYDFLFKSCKKRPEKFTIVYAGTFYGKRKPDHFLQALNALIGKEIDHVQVEIIGAVKPISIPDKLENTVRIRARMKYEALIKYLQENAALLLLISPNNLELGVYSGKIFDYLGCGRPVLGLVPKNDVAAKLIEQAEAGYVAEEDDIEEIRAIMVKAYQDWLADKPFSPNRKIILAHHRSEQAKRLHGLIESLL